MFIVVLFNLIHSPVNTIYCSQVYIVVDPIADIEVNHSAGEAMVQAGPYSSPHVLHCVVAPDRFGIIAAEHLYLVLSKCTVLLATNASL